jgi:hypothetical protein
VSGPEVFVIAGHIRSKDGVALLAYDPAIHADTRHEKYGFTFSRADHRWQHRQATLTMQAVNRATASIMFIAGSEESPAKHEGDSWRESQTLFLPGFMSR